jgi:hypothetical protein
MIPPRLPAHSGKILSVFSKWGFDKAVVGKEDQGGPEDRPQAGAIPVEALQDIAKQVSRDLFRVDLFVDPRDFPEPNPSRSGPFFGGFMEKAICREWRKEKQRPS